MNSDLRARATRSFREVTNYDPPPSTDAYLETTLDHVFGEIWTRPGLSRKERRWISLTIAACDCATTGRESHLRSALESGDISRTEMLEFAVHFAHYAGWPRSAELYGTLQKVCAELDAQGPAVGGKA